MLLVELRSVEGYDGARRGAGYTKRAFELIKVIAVVRDEVAYVQTIQMYV